jgi:hypothetical protein
VGVVPQGRFALGDIDLNAVHNMALYEPTDTSINLDYIQMSGKARVTDFVQTGVLSLSGFTISSKALQLLQKYNLCAHQTIPVVLEYRKKKYDNYQWFQFAEDNTKDIVFPESVLMTFRNIPVEIPGWDYDYRNVDVNNYDEFFKFYKEQKDALSFFTAKKLTLQKKLSDRDMIILRGFQRLAMITGRLKKAIEESKVSGMEFKAVPFEVKFV